MASRRSAAQIPGFNETYYGYRAFSDLLEEAGEKGLINA